MMKKLRQYIILWMAATAILTGCSQDEVTDSPIGVPFSLSVGCGDINKSRVVDSDVLPNGAQLGVQLVKSGSTELYLPTTGNLLFTHSGTSYGSWTASPTTYLNAAQATAYAYYPYNADVTDFTTIPVQSGTTDYMYGQSIQDVNDGSPQAIIYMHHALAAVRLSAKLGTAAAMYISSVKLEGTGYYATASMNAYTGDITGGSGNGPLTISYDTPLALSSTAQNIDFALIPTDAPQTLTFTITDGNGVQQTLTTEPVQLQCNTLHTIELTADYGGALTFGSITVGDWGYSDEGYPVIQAGNYTVTLAGDITGIAFSNQVDDNGTVTINAVSIEAGKTVSEVTCTDGADFTQSVNYNGLRTILLTNLTGDVTLLFSGIE